MDKIISKAVLIDAYFDDNNWIFRKGQENISIDDYNNYLIITLCFTQDNNLLGMDKDLKCIFINYKQLWCEYSIYSNYHRIILLNKNTYYKCLPYKKFVNELPETDDQHTVYIGYTELPRTNGQYVVYVGYNELMDQTVQTNCDITEVPTENNENEIYLIFEKRKDLFE